jgi:hypothetical protein
LSTVGFRLVTGERTTAVSFGTLASTNRSSAARRVDSGSPTSDFPRASTSRSKTTSAAGCSAASFVTRLCAGWMRSSSSSKDSERPCGITISPSSTNRFAFSSCSVATTSGK